MLGTAMALLCMLSVGQSPNTALCQALHSSLVDGVMFESDIHWHRGDYARAGMARLLGGDLTLGDTVAYTDSAWLAWSWGHTDLGRAVCRRALAVNPDDPGAAYEVAALVRLWGDVEWSLELLQRAHRGDPGDSVTALALGAALRARERWSEAAAVYRVLEAHHPGDPSAARFLQRYDEWGHMRPAEQAPDAPNEAAPSREGSG